MKISFIDYGELDEFYTIQQLVDLLNLKKSELKEKCEQYGIKPRRNEIDDGGFVRYEVRKLHNKLYHESRCDGKDWGSDASAVCGITFEKEAIISEFLIRK